MLPYEVVARREAHGSYLKRNPHLAKGHLFPRLIVEFFLKTKDKKWRGKPLVCDDPMMQYADGGKQIELFNPAKPIVGQEPFLVLTPAEVFGHDDEWKMFPEMRRIVRQTFLALEKAWQLEGGTLVDLKVESGRRRQPAAGGRDRQRFMARARGRCLYRQAGLSRGRCA
jgi:phosphoribosylaminoimidazole carboxylase/phosphoribosylaminoimidazole-succinocarboxamide synthase